MHRPRHDSMPIALWHAVYAVQECGPEIMPLGNDAMYSTRNSEEWMH
jgi:hypothetical protein